MTENHQKLKNALNKFTKIDLINIVAENVWFKGSLPKNIPVKVLKKDIIDCLMKNLNDSNLEDIVLSIKLLYLQTHSTSKTWHILKISNELGMLKHVKHPRTFERKLEYYLNFNVLECSVHCEVFKEGFWVQLNFRNLTSTSRRTKEVSTYLVYYPLSPYVAYSDMKIIHRSIIHKALMQILEGTEITEISLSGKHIHTLIQLIWQKDGLTFTQKHANPCFIPCIPIQKQIKEKIPNVIEYNEDECHDKYIQENYGPYKQPPLENLICTMNTRFYGFDENHDFDQQVACKVSFKGQSILEGFQRLIELKMVEPPLPDYIAKIGQLAQNRFHITEKLQD